MKELGVEILHLRDDKKDIVQGEKLITEGYELVAPPDADITVLDNRYFVRVSEPGVVTYFDKYRFFLKTDRELPEGSCGGPALDADGRVAGVVEAVVSPKQTHEEMNMLVGQGALIPSYLVAHFLEWAEKEMLQQIVPKNLYEMVIRIKEGQELSVEEAAQPNADPDSNFHQLIEALKKRLPPEKMDALMAAVQRDKSETIDILEKEGGNADEIIERVREKNWKFYEGILLELLEQEQREKEAREGTSNEGERLSNDGQGSSYEEDGLSNEGASDEEVEVLHFESPTSTVGRDSDSEIKEAEFDEKMPSQK
jgi:hypothetical protein